MQDDLNTFVVRLNPQMGQKLQQFGRLLNVDPKDMVAQALSLWWIVQGRWVEIKDKKNRKTWVNNKYVNRPTLLDLDNEQS